MNRNQLHACALLFILGTSFSQTARGICADIVDLSVELPPQIMTDGGLEIAYVYDLDADTYQLSVHGDGVDTPMFGPFPLTMSCGTPQLRWENSDFLITDRSCGTFCWYAQVFPLADTGDLVYQRIDRPLAFDPESNLLAYYLEQDVIRVRNLATGSTQDILTSYRCEYYSGLCFDAVTLHEDRLSYRWISPDSGPAGSIIMIGLNADLY